MTYRSAPLVTRAANTTAYTAGDVLGGVIRFVGMGPAGGHILITSFDLMARITAVPSGMTNFRLHLYDDVPASGYVDNDAWDLPSGDRANYLGFINGNVMEDLGSTVYMQDNQVNRQFKLAEGQTSLWGYLVTTGAFTPAANSEVYVPRLRAIGL